MSSRGPGRPRKRIDPGAGPRAILAQELRDLLDASGCRTYRNLELWAGVPHRRLADAGRDGQPPPWKVIESYVQGCRTFSEHVLGRPLDEAGDMSRWRQLYRDAGGTLPAKSPREGTCPEPVPPLVPETAAAPAAMPAQAPPFRRGLSWRPPRPARRILVPTAAMAACAAFLTATVIAGLPRHAVRPDGSAVPAGGIFVAAPGPTCGRIAQDGLRSPATTTFRNVRTVGTVSLENTSAAVLQGQHDGLNYDWVESQPAGSRAGIQLRWSSAPQHWHYCTATVAGGNVSTLPGQVATMAVPATPRGLHVRFQACIWHQHPYTAQCSGLF